MSILRLIAQVGLDKTGFDAGLAQAGKQVNQFGSTLKSQLAGGFGAAAFLALARSTMEYGDSLDELSERLGITAQQAQDYALAARLGGADSEFFASRFEKLRKAMSDGKEKGANPLAAFGIEAENAQDAIEQLAIHIQKVGVNTEQANALMTIFGKGGGKMINILGDLANARLGVLGFSKEDITRLKEADDTLTKLGVNAKVIFANLTGAALSWRGAVSSLSPVLGLLSKLSPGSGGPSIAKPTISGDDDDPNEVQRKAHMATMDRINAHEKSINEGNEKARQARLTTEERLNELIKYRAVLLENLSTEETNGTGIFQEGAYIMMDALSKTNAEIEELGRKRFTETQKANNGFALEESALGRIGAFTGASAAAQSGNGVAQTNAILQRMHELLDHKGIIVKDAVR
jgi:hypothetical protein